MSRLNDFLWWGLLFGASTALCLWPLLGLAQDAAPIATPTAVPLDPSYLFSLGPIGALVYGAYLLGKGVNLNINVSVDEDDRALFRRGVEAVERVAASMSEWSVVRRTSQDG